MAKFIINLARDLKFSLRMINLIIQLFINIAEISVIIYVAVINVIIVLTILNFINYRLQIFVIYLNSTTWGKQILIFMSLGPVSYWLIIYIVKAFIQVIGSIYLDPSFNIFDLTLYCIEDSNSADQPVDVAGRVEPADQSLDEQSGHEAMLQY